MNADSGIEIGFACPHFHRNSYTRHHLGSIVTDNMGAYDFIGSRIDQQLQENLATVIAKCVLEMPKAVSGDGSESGGTRREEIDALANEERGAASGEKPSLGEYEAGADRVERFMEEAARG